jgi:carbonic anhydrase
MYKHFVSSIAFFIICTSSHAANWVRLGDNDNSKLMLDKQTILQQDSYKKAWVKVDYKKPHINPETLDTQYNSAKLLWLFDCNAQKSATSQVFQYFNNVLVYSAGVEAKNAEFIEPVPESDVDVAMRYVCQDKKPAAAESAVKTEKSKDSKPTDAKPSDLKTNEAKPTDAKPTDLKTNEAKPTDAKPTDAKTEEVKAETPIKTEAAEAKPGSSIKKADTKDTSTKSKTSKADTKKPTWSYEGKDGPENWGKLDSTFSTCATGLNQSPINIENTLHATLKPVRGIHKFPAKEVINNGHTVQVNFKTGNMLVLDSAAYQLKELHFHAPSENTINKKSFPLEAQLIHADNKGNLTIISVMFKDGNANAALDKLWLQLSSKNGEPASIKTRVIPSELMPENRSYYRFSGSLTKPPCTEGVRWIVLKTPMTASKAQIETFEAAIKHKNNRPIQAINGRVVVEQ